MTAIPEAIRTSLNATLDYLWGDEQANYEADPSPDHIFLHLQTILIWLEGLDGDDGGNGGENGDDDNAPSVSVDQPATQLTA